MPLGRLRELLQQILEPGPELGKRERAIGEPLLHAVIARLGFLIDVGLDYLTLDRSTQRFPAAKGNASGWPPRSVPRLWRAVRSG